MTQEELDVQSQIKSVAPPAQIQPAPSVQPKKPFIPSLKTAGLGLSTLVKDGGKTQEELDVESQVKGNQAPSAISEPVQPPSNPVHKKPVIPMLKTGGLGFSTIIKEGGKTQEELDVESQIKPAK